MIIQNKIVIVVVLIALFTVLTAKEKVIVKDNLGNVAIDRGQILSEIILCLTVNEKVVTKDKWGNVINDKGQILIAKENIITDSKGNEKEWDINDIFISISSWYDNKINLDKLEELKAAGFDTVPIDPKIKDIWGKFERSGVTAEAIIIGEIIESENPDLMKTGYHVIYNIKVDEIIKDSKNIAIGKEIRCGLYFKNMVKDPPLIGQKRVFVIRKTNAPRKLQSCPILLLSAWEIDNGIIKGKPNGFDDMSISLDKYKKRVQEVIRINDADNFYRRSWKEDQ